jgi:glycosyltransferase involved in cell wall biosynthesis
VDPAETPELSVVVLCYRAEEHTAAVVEPLHRLLEESGVAFALVLVANAWPGRADTTPEHARALAGRLPRTLVVAREKAGDMGWDMRSGLEAASGDQLVVIDGDGQVPVEYALEVHRELVRTGADVVKGRRYLREDGTIRTLNSLVFNVLFVLLFGTFRLWDVNGRPKGFTRAAWERLDLRTDDWFTDSEILLEARRHGLRVHELHVHFLENPARGSFVHVGTVFEFLRNMLLWRLGAHPAQRAKRSAQR